MPQMVRTFVAIDVSESVRARASDLIRRLSATGAKVRWSSAENMHLTLKFLGDTDMNDVPDVCRVVAEAAAAAAPFSLSVGGAGAFPNVSRPRTLWIGATEGLEPARELHDLLNVGLAELGFPSEQRQFFPHLTIGRVKQGGRELAELTELLERHRSFDAGATAVDEVVVYSSELRREGAIYTPLATSRLSGGR